MTNYNVAYYGLTGALMLYLLTRNSVLVILAMFAGAVVGAVVEGLEA